MLERTHVGLLDDNKVKVRKIDEEKEIDLYTIRTTVTKDVLNNISRITSEKVIRFTIKGKLNWDVNIVKCFGSGMFNDGEYEVKLLIEVRDYKAD